jgi:hypothetical protein
MTVTVSSNSFTSGTQYSPNLVGAPGAQSEIARGQRRGQEPEKWRPVLATVTPSPSRFTTRLLASLSAVATKMRKTRRFIGECSIYCMNHTL